MSNWRCREYTLFVTAYYICPRKQDRMHDYSFQTKTQEPYALLLERREWKAKRDHILIRDGYRCQRCGATEEDGISLHVHHIHYIRGLDPWEYKDTELITLCESCHEHVHETEDVPEYHMREGGILERVLFTPCKRCHGVGYFREYRHIRGGVCFRCMGSRHEEFVQATLDYAKEHNIEVSDLAAGFLPLSEETKSKIMCAVLTKDKSNRDFIAITMTDGQMRRAYPDYSMEIRCGDSFEIDSLLYRTHKRKETGTTYVVLKGRVKK